MTTNRDRYVVDAKVMMQWKGVVMSTVTVTGSGDSFRRAFADALRKLEAPFQSDENSVKIRANIEGE